MSMSVGVKRTRARLQITAMSERITGWLRESVRDRNCDNRDQLKFAAYCGDDKEEKDKKIQF